MIFSSKDYAACDTCGKKFDIDAVCDERPDDFPAIRCEECYALDLAESLKED